MHEQIKDIIKNVDTFGVIDGFKVKVMNLLGKYTEKKKLMKYYSKKLKGIVWLRNNTTDILMAKILLCTNGEYDFLSKFEKQDVSVIIDAGANVGLFSRIAYSIWPDSCIIAIEANSDNSEVCRKNLSFINRATVYNKGLWNCDTRLCIEGRATGEIGFVVKEADNGEVEAISVDTLMKLHSLEHIDIFKIDIEGSEMEVFDESCESWVDKVGMYIVETHDRFRAGSAIRVENRLISHGYCKIVFGENEVYIKNETKKE